MPEQKNIHSTPEASASQSPGLHGSVTAPGDKSISHRSIIFGALANGKTEVHGLLEGADILSTIGAMRAFGADITRDNQGVWHVEGCGTSGLQTPDDVIDCGNAGTGVRLIMGAAAAYPVQATYTGDESLRSRPMRRILDPLREMGIGIESTGEDRLPATISGSKSIKAIGYTPAQASAQVKSAVLLAGLGARGETVLRELSLSRDHTENMLEAFGAQVSREPLGDGQLSDGQIVRLTGPQSLRGTRVDVPGDPSSAAFPIVAALITPGSDVTIKNVMMNPTRTGLIETLWEMGADIAIVDLRRSGGETIADLRVRHSELHGVEVPPHRAPAMIDEYPILAIAATCASGATIMNGIHELRVKESDRISATAALLKANGCNVDEREDGMTVFGGRVSGGGRVTTHHDHRIAMSALVLGLVAEKPVTIDDASMIATSFPDFFDLMNTIGARIKVSP